MGSLMGELRKKIRVLVADDHAIMRQCLRALLACDPVMEIVGEAADGKEAVELAAALKPDVVLIDLAMPQLNGIEAMCQIHARCPGARLLVLTTYSDQSLVHRALEAGATGYLLKHSAAGEILHSIHQACAAKRVFSPPIEKLLAHQRQNQTANTLCPLTARERTVLELIAAGRCNKEIAADLDISIKTVEKHRQNAMDKLNIHTIAGLTQYAVVHGIQARPASAGI